MPHTTRRAWEEARGLLAEHLDAWGSSPPIRILYMEAVEELERAVQPLHVLRVTPEHLHDVKQRLEREGTFPGEVILQIVAWRTFFEALVQRGWLVSNPAADLTLPQAEPTPLRAGRPLWRLLGRLDPRG